MEQNDYQEAISYLEEGFAISSPLCTKELGELYYHGDYVQKDIRKATDYFLEGYKLHSKVSTYYLGKILFYGEGCVENKKKGRELINKALSLGYVDQEGDIYESDGAVYLTGRAPGSNDTGADIEYTLTLTINNGCGGGSTTLSDASKQIKIVHQKWLHYLDHHLL